MAGRDFWHHLRECMGRIGFTSSRADPDVWFRLSTRSTGEVYYEYVFLYVDNVLVILERAESVLRNEIGKFFVLKDLLKEGPKHPLNPTSVVNTSWLEYI